MAISREELTAAALAGSAGPLTLAVGAGVLAAGSTLAPRAPASSSVVLPEDRTRTGGRRGRSIRRATNGVRPE